MKIVDPNVFDAEDLTTQAVIAAQTGYAPLQAHIAAHSEDVPTLIALARNRHLARDVQTILANNEHGLSLQNREDPLSSSSAWLMTRDDLQYYPARLIMEENTPAVTAMILANAASEMVRRAAAVSNVHAHRTLL